MKTLKTKLLPGFLFLAVILPLLVSSCTKDEVDIRDEVVGQYNYTVKAYEIDGNDLVYVGNEGDVGDITGTMRVVKNTNSLTVLDFFDGNDRMFQGINVKDAGNAIVFDVPLQTAWIGPGNVQVTGYNYWDVENASYHGAFLYADNSIEIAFTVRVMDVDTGMVMILTAF